MTAILKVDEIQDTAGNLIIKEDSNTITVGASGDTVTIPSGATITNSGTNGGGFGKLLQVVNATATSQTITSSTSFADTALSASITPSSTSNKVLVWTFSNVEISGSASGYITFDRDGTTLTGNNGFGVIQDNNGAKNSSFHFLDTPSSSSALTYKVQIKTSNASVNVHHNPNGAKAAITLMEIEG